MSLHKILNKSKQLANKQQNKYMKIAWETPFAHKVIRAAMFIPTCTTYVCVCVFACKWLVMQAAVRTYNERTVQMMLPMSVNV